VLFKWNKTFSVSLHAQINYMKKSLLFLSIASITLAMTSCSETKISNVKLETAADSLSYAIGIYIGQDFKTQELTEVDGAIMAAVINAILADDTADLALNDSTATVFLNNYMRKKQEVKMEETKKEGITYLENNAKKSGVIVTPSGLQYTVVKSGSGISPVDGDITTVHYTGKFIDGEIFDSSVERGQPGVLPVNQWITGMTEALKMMKEGDKWTIYVPSELGYGPGGYQGVIPPNSALIFDLELLKVEKGTAPEMK
jgi:FKBP-type peptidyl-prolyl cis-trans isomerase